MRSDFERQRGLYYLQRYDELKKARLLPVACAVAEAFTDEDLLGDAELDAAVERAAGEDSDPEQRDCAVNTLRRLGFIWRSGPDPRWEPGIPSLMDYIREHAPP